MEFYARFVHDTHGGYTVSFRDIPEALTQGDDLEDAKAMAADALRTALEFYLEDGRAVPTPSPAQEGEIAISLPQSST
jgi:antitoxin HicB